ncbi:MAG: amidohydrolase, partial [Granulicatella sp.]
MHYFVKSKHLFIGDSKETIEGILEIKDGKIAAILPYHEEVDGEIIDTGDQMVTPGFIDAHVHLYLSSLIHLGKMKAVGATSIEEVVAQAKEIPVYNGWKIGIGWYASDFGQQVLPTKEDLDKASNEVPICLIAGDAHTIWLNTKALEELGLTSENIPSEIGGEAVKKDG